MFIAETKELIMSNDFIMNACEEYKKDSKNFIPTIAWSTINHYL